MKLMPILFYVLLFAEGGEVDSRLLYIAAGCGAGFATLENCCYILASGAESLTYTLIRGAAVGVMHLLTAVAFAMGFMLLRHFKAFSFAGVVGGLSLSMTIHALYNLLVSVPGVSSVVGYLLPIPGILLLYFIFRRYRTE